MKDDYLSWYHQNEDFFETLFKYDSLIFNHLRDTIKVLSYISNQEKASEDLEVFYDIGFSYIYNKVNEIKYYLENYFQNNLEKFLKYERLINYSLYLDDLKDTLIEKKVYTDNVKEAFMDVSQKIEDILKNKKHFDDDDFKQYDIIIESVIPPQQYITIPEIFQRAAEELQL